MNNTQTQIYAANTSTSSATDSGSYLVATPDPDGGGIFVHKDEWREFKGAIASGDSLTAKKVFEEAQKRYEFLEAMLPGTPLTPENLEELFDDLEDCKALMNTVTEDLQDTLMNGFRASLQEGEDIDDIDSLGRVYVDTIVHRIPAIYKRSRRYLPV
jgi:phytoene dehydrogenase-like protein